MKFTIPNILNPSVEEKFTIPNKPEPGVQLFTPKGVQNFFIIPGINQDFTPGINSLGPVNPDVDNNSIFPINVFGMPFIGDIIFCPGKQEYIDSNNLNKFISLDEVKVAICLLTINNHKNIIKTSLLGRDGTVKTYMNNGDYDITIEMTLIAPDDPTFVGSNYNGVYPYNLVQNMIKICEAPCPINVTSYYLNQFGISNIVIDSYEISQEEGKYSEQRITINAISDFPDTYKTIINY